MDFLWLWLGTSVLSLGMEVINELRLFKEIADKGYKIKWEKLGEIGLQMDLKELIFSFLIPFVNIFKVMQMTVELSNHPSILSQLEIWGVLEEMNELEKVEYQKNPTILNALVAPIKIYRRAKKAEYVEHDDGLIYYERGNDFTDIEIIQSTGSNARLSVNEQKKIVLETLKEVLESAHTFDDYEDFKQNIIGDMSYVFEDDSLTENLNNKKNNLIHLNREKQELIELKDELLSIVKNDDYVKIK